MRREEDCVDGFVVAGDLTGLAGCATTGATGAKPATSDGTSSPRSPGARPMPSAATNVVAFSGPTLGNGELNTNQCQSGGRRSFLGVDAYDQKSDCSTFDYVLENTGNVVNFVSEMKFGMHLDCRGPKGDRVVGNVDLPACL